jgi:hypothetical protein
LFQVQAIESDSEIECGDEDEHPACGRGYPENPAGNVAHDEVSGRNCAENYCGDEGGDPSWPATAAHVPKISDPDVRAASRGAKMARDRR